MSFISGFTESINIIEERDKKIAELEERLRIYEHETETVKELQEKLKERDSVRLWNENEDLKKKLQIAIEALGFYAECDNWGHIDPYKNDYRMIDKIDIGKGDFQISETVDDSYVGGLKAREALEEIK